MSLEIRGVSKTYPNKLKAVSNLSLDLDRGEVFGLVGPNGAGKSTLLKVICGLLKAEEGHVLYDGEDITGDPRAAARFVGLMPDPLGVYTDITARDYLEFFARVLAIPQDHMQGRIDGVVEELELGPWLSEEVETLSAGWQRRLALGRILLADMPVLLLDEPAAGLDVAARKELLEIVKRLAAGDRAIIISSHILPELEDLADRFGIIDEGAWRTVKDGKVFFTRKDLSAGLGAQAFRIRCSDPERAASLLSGAVEDSAVCVQVTRGDEQMADCIDQLCKEGINVYEARRISADLSGVVLEVLGRREGDES